MEVNMNEEGKQEEKKAEKPKRERKKVLSLEEMLTTKNALFSFYKATKGLKVENNYVNA
jgi:fructose-1,6-bisphosphatase/sedoheptulose 1,7-bisphosphatase-like protein